MDLPQGENPYIYGMHDRGGEHLLLVKETAKGWVLVTEELGADPNNTGGSNYTDLAKKGLGVIVRLNHAYGTNGTIPHSSQYNNFARRVANFVNNSPGAHIWLIGNEMNFAREQPRQPGSSQPEVITPRRYATCYRLCRDAIRRLSGHANDQVIIGAPAPWNAETTYDADPDGKYTANRLPGGPNGLGDWVKYLADICLAIGAENCDGIAIHAYTHGVDPKLVTSDGKMDSPFNKYHYHFRTYRDQMNAIPSNMRHLPVYLTEMDEDEAWEDSNRGWVKSAYQEIDAWNKAGHQQIRAAILYRWPRADKWHIDGKEQVQKDFQEAIAKNYQWNIATATIEAEVDMSSQSTTPPATEIPSRAPYRTRFTNHNTPATVPASQTLTISLTLQNVGGRTWVREGPNPFTLGFQWYTMDSQMVSFPQQLDFHTPLPVDIPPNQTVTLQARLRTPDTPGAYHLRWDMLHEGITWFTTQGDQGLLVSPVTVTPAGAQPSTGVTPIPTQAAIRIQDVSAALAHHPTKRYPTRSRAVIRRIIIHHTATPPDVTIIRIANYQVSNRDLPGIAYHYCITAQGIPFVTQPAEVQTTHAGNYSGDSLGVCLIGNFTDTPPPQAQLAATAAVLAQVATQFGISLDQIVGYSELVVTGSPGATWPTWKAPLLAQVGNLVAAGPAQPTSTQQPAETGTPAQTPTPTRDKPIAHYMLLWHNGPGNWAQWDFMGTTDYINQFPVTVGFSIEEAKLARFVTIIGGTSGVPATAEQTLRAAGCQVERLAGRNETETRQILQQLAAQGRRFATLSE